MEISRRHFLVSAAACACAFTAGCANNPAPVFDAGIDHSIPLPAALSEPGSQIKVRLPHVPEPVLVCRTKVGFSGTSCVCPQSSTSEVVFNSEENTLDCVGCASRYKLDGTVIQGPSKVSLRAYVVDLKGDRLLILG